LRLGNARGLAESRLVITSSGRVEIAGQISAVVSEPAPGWIAAGGGLAVAIQAALRRGRPAR
jgi:hypothetical protein